MNDDEKVIHIICVSGQLLNSIDKEEKLLGTIFLAGQSRQVWFLTEDGLYEVLMQSRKPIANNF